MVPDVVVFRAELSSLRERFGSFLRAARVAPGTPQTIESFRIVRFKADILFEARRSVRSLCQFKQSLGETHQSRGVVGLETQPFTIFSDRGVERVQRPVIHGPAKVNFGGIRLFSQERFEDFGGALGLPNGGVSLNQ